MDGSDIRSQIVDAADRLFYSRGISNVGMDAVRDAAHVSLRALYKEFASKEDLILAVLALRHGIWTTGVEAKVGEIADPGERLLAIYDYLTDWFNEPGFRGCGFINAFGEVGASSPRVAEAVRVHKESFQRYVDQLVAEAGGTPVLAAQLAILAEGAQTTAAIAGTDAAASAARGAAKVLIENAGLEIRNDAAGEHRSPASRLRSAEAELAETTVNESRAFPPAA